MKAVSFFEYFYLTVKTVTKTIETVKTVTKTIETVKPVTKLSKLLHLNLTKLSHKLTV